MAVGTDSKAAMPFPVGKPGQRNVTLSAESRHSQLCAGHARDLRLYSETTGTHQACRGPGTVPLSPVLGFDSCSLLGLLRGGSL